MPDHVCVREVHDDGVESAFFDGVNHCIGDPRRRHFRLQIVCRNLRRGYEDALLASEGFFDATVEKIGDVRVLFGFRHTQIAQVKVGKNVRQDVLELFRPKDVAQPRPGLFILSHRDECEALGARRVREFVKPGFDERPRDLPRAVSSEIEEDHGIVVADHAARHGRLPGTSLGRNHGGQDELVRHVSFVARPHHGDGIARSGFGIAVNHRAIRLLDALPTVVAVHGVVAAGNARDLPDAVFAHLLLEPAQEVDPALRWRVAAIGEAVHVDVRDLVFPRHAQERKEVLDVRMNSAVAQETDEVQLPAARAIHRVDQKRLAEKLAARDELVDACDVHLNDAASAHIQVANFAVAHLSFGQAHMRPGGVNQGVRKILQQAVVIRLARKSDGVALRPGMVAPAVEHGEHDWYRSVGHGFSGGGMAVSGRSAPGGRGSGRRSPIPPQCGGAGYIWRRGRFGRRSRS